MKRYYFMTVTGMGPSISSPFDTGALRKTIAKKTFREESMDDLDDLYFLDMDDHGNLFCYSMTAKDL